MLALVYSRRILMVGFLLATIIFQSCIKEAPQNPEADIETFGVDTSLLTSNVYIDQANRKILLYLTAAANRSGIAPIITTSNGATVFPASGDSIHFRTPVQYSVTSASGENTKVYDVVIVAIGKWEFNFENWSVNDNYKYQVPMEKDGTQPWSSGNPGIALLGVSKEPDAYPTQSINEGLDGTNAAVLYTIKGNAFAAYAGVYMFPGILFLGNFNTEKAFSEPPKATEYGQPYAGLPSRFTGYYKYTPGADYQNEKGNIIPSVKDECAIYAVLFRGPGRLDGTNILSSDKIIATAMVPTAAPDKLTRFDIPFTVVDTTNPGTNLMMAIVASSSKDANNYHGAVGSKLVVDSLRIVPRTKKR